MSKKLKTQNLLYEDSKEQNEYICGLISRNKLKNIIAA